MKKKIISLWKNLLILFKILLVLWTLYSLTALLVLNVFQWIVIWFFGSFLFIYCPNEILNSIKKKITSKRKHTNINFENLDSNNIDERSSKSQSTYNSSKSDSIEKVLRMQKEFELKQLEENYNIICQHLEDNNNELVKNVGEIISDTYRSFGIEILVSNASFYANQVIFKIVPHEGVRIKTILSFKDDLSLRLGTNIDMEVFSQLGYIGIIIPIDFFKM